MLPHDPNGIDLPDWRRYGYASYEAWIGEKAGQSPALICRHGHTLGCACSKCVSGWCDWPLPEIPADSEEESSDPADQ